MPKKQYPLRLDAELYEVIERWANDEFRSVNAHIEFLLRDAARRAGRLRKGSKAAREGGGPGEEPDDESKQT